MAPRGPGRPFVKGGDPRQWRGGRGKTPLTDALRATLSVVDMEAVVGALLALAKGGNIQAIREVFDRLEGKAIARTEQGEPGDFWPRTCRTFHPSSCARRSAR